MIRAGDTVSGAHGLSSMLHYFIDKSRAAFWWSDVRELRRWSTDPRLTDSERSTIVRRLHLLESRKRSAKSIARGRRPRHVRASV